MPALVGTEAQQAGQAIEQLKQKYGTALQTLNASGVPSPTTQGAGTSGVQAAIETQPNTQPEPPSIVGALQETDPSFDALFTQYDQFFSPENQRTSLLDEYKKLSDSLGIDKINSELIDTKKIIDGTEDDIRNEITSAGGLATDSQVMAMGNARNKSLIKNYNYLLDTKNAATTQLQTMMQLSVQDRQFAEAEFDRKLNFGMKVMEFKQQATQNARSTYSSLISSGHADALLGNSYQNSLIEKTMGLGAGSLQKLATEAVRQRNASNLKTEVVDVGGRKFLINSQTGATIKEIGGGSNSPTAQVQLAQSQGNIQQISELTNNPAISSAVGPSFLSRAASGIGGVLGRFTAGATTGATIGAAAGAPFAGVGVIPGAIVGGLIGGTALAAQGAKNKLTGEQQNFIAGVEQLRAGLNLQSLIEAKQKGATFGALSDNEGQMLANAASKIGTWTIKDGSGNVVGYNTSEANFKKELDKINGFAKLDYVLKGGDPVSVGVQKIDGHYYTQNSDGSVTQID